MTPTQIVILKINISINVVCCETSAIYSHFFSCVISLVCNRSSRFHGYNRNAVFLPSNEIKQLCQRRFPIPWMLYTCILNLALQMLSAVQISWRRINVLYLICGTPCSKSLVKVPSSALIQLLNMSPLLLDVFCIFIFDKKAVDEN